MKDTIDDIIYVKDDTGKVLYWYTKKVWDYIHSPKVQKALANIEFKTFQKMKDTMGKTHKPKPRPKPGPPPAHPSKEEFGEITNRYLENLANSKI